MLSYGGFNGTALDLPRRKSLIQAPLTGQAPLQPYIAPPVMPGQQNTTGQQPIRPPTLQPGGPNIGPTVPQLPIGPTTPQYATDTGGPLQDFGPGNDLRSTQINPYTGDRLSGIQSGTDVLFKALQNGPNLTDAAKQAFDVLGQQTAEQRRLGIQDIGRNAARLGRLGSGMVTTDLGNLEDVLQQHQNQARSQLASQLAFAQGNEARANLGAAQGLESQLYGQGVGARNEVRGERDYQQQLAQRAQDQEILRKQLEVAYQQYLQQLGLQGAGLYGQQAAASQGAAANLLGGIK